MQVNSPELSFPCPACGVRLTIQQPVADGPCPHCHIPIQVEFNVGLRQADTVLKDILPISKEAQTSNSFDRRRFRPAGGSVKLGIQPRNRITAKG